MNTKEVSASFTKASACETMTTSSSTSTFVATKTPFLIDDILFPNTDKCPSENRLSNNNNSSVCGDNNNCSETSTNLISKRNTHIEAASNGLYGGSGGGDEDYRKIIQSDR